ncbi:MAG TPA: hypothetical protein DCR04_05335 [Flavobacteriales bacterium]|nr:hypothetical protein [Flavobacteriales bacterium]
MKFKSIEKSAIKHSDGETVTSKKLAITMELNDMILCHGGSNSHELNTEIIKTVEEKLLDIEERKLVRKRVVNVLIESLSNLTNHSCKTADALCQTAVTLTQAANYYVIQCTNRIKKNEIPVLEERLKKLAVLDNKNLGEVYRQVLIQNKPSTKGGAGLGLIDLTRKANGNVSYEFTEKNENCFFFTLSININRLKAQ